jgi:alanine dehydrogenase
LALLLHEEEVRSILTMPMALEAIEISFRRLANGEALVHPRRRMAIPRKSYLHYMAAGDTVSGYMGMKVYTSAKEGLRFLVLLFSAESGDLLAVIEADYLGQIRTGAASGLATRWMAREEAKIAAIIGTGRQARTQLEAITAVRAIEKVSVFSRNPAHREEFCRVMAEKLKLSVTPANSAEEAVCGAHILATATNSSTPVIEGRWLAKGVHINAIGANFPEKRELDDEGVLRANWIVVDSIKQSREESGDLIQAFGGREERWGSVKELAQVIRGKVPGRTSVTEITLFKSNGIASEDIAVAGKILEIARERKIGRAVQLWDDLGRASKTRGM